MLTTMSPVAAIAITLIGIGIIVIGFNLSRRYKMLVRVCTAQTAGTVVDLECRLSSEIDTDAVGHKKIKSHPCYFPIITYTVGEETITITSSAGSNPPAFKPSQTVTVCYNPDNIKQFYVAEDKNRRFTGIIIIAFGVVVTILGLIHI